MQKIKCPTCGSETVPDAVCPSCGDAANNGTTIRPEPVPPPEVATWVIEPVPPEVREHFLRTFDEAEYLAEIRELERTGGVQIDDLIEEIERRLDGHV